MSDNIFDQEWYKRFNHISMDEFLKISQRFYKFDLSSKDVEDAIKLACDFFNIPMPRIVAFPFIGKATIEGKDIQKKMD